MTTMTGLANKDQSFEISGASIGLAKRLRVPDDLFCFLSNPKLSVL